MIVLGEYIFWWSGILPCKKITNCRSWPNLASIRSKIVQLAKLDPLLQLIINFWWQSSPTFKICQTSLKSSDCVLSREQALVLFFSGVVQFWNFCANLQFWIVKSQHLLFPPSLGTRLCWFLQSTTIRRDCKKCTKFETKDIWAEKHGWDGFADLIAGDRMNRFKPTTASSAAVSLPCYISQFFEIYSW